MTLLHLIILNDWTNNPSNAQFYETFPKLHLILHDIPAHQSCLFSDKYFKICPVQSEGKESYGILTGELIQELQGDLFSAPVKTGKHSALSKVKLLAPCNPSKVLAVGLNYRSHIGDRPIPDHMGLFAKYPTCIIAHEAPIMMPSDATDLHYEGELVVVIGKMASKIAVADAPDYIFGITAGNDVSERNWQKIDLQWLRAKGSDTFGPIGPAIVTGLRL